MRLYETTFIVNPQTDDATIATQVKAVTDLIAAGGGKIVYENLMGTRRMAYAIKKHTQGYYANFIFESPKSVVSDIDRHMRLGEAYLRHLTIAYDGVVPDKDAPPAEVDMGFGRRGDRGDRPFGRRESGGDRRPRHSEAHREESKAPSRSADEKPASTDAKPAKEVDEDVTVDVPAKPEAEAEPKPAPEAETPAAEPVNPPESADEATKTAAPAEEPAGDDYQEDEEL